MSRSVSQVLFVVGVALICLASAPAHAAPKRELVVGSEKLAEAGKYLDESLGLFCRRVEEVAGWPKESLSCKAFTRPEDALRHIRKKRSAFAILPVHQLAEARKELKLEVLGRAVGVEGAKVYYWAVTRKPRPFQRLSERQGLRLAATEIHDPAWIQLVFESTAIGKKHFTLVEVPSGQAALQALEAGKADLALLNEGEWQAIQSRVDDGGPLEHAHTSEVMPPPAFVAVGKFAAAKDRKELGAALEKICKTTGATACGRMGIMYIQAGRAGTYDDVVSRYDSFR